MEMITEEQLEKLVWKEPIWQTDPGCSKPGCGYPDGKPCIGCGRTMTLELFIAEASRFRSQRDALDQRLKAVTELARQGLRLQQKENEGRSCSVCAWTNHGCLNLGNPNEKPKWVCHGCIKRGFDQLSTLQNPLEASKRDTERLSFCIRWGYLDCIMDYVANGKLEPRGCIDFLIDQCLDDHAINAERKPQTIDEYCGQPSGTFQQFVKDNPNPEALALNAERKEKL